MQKGGSPRWGVAVDARFAMVPIPALADRRLTYRQLVVLSAICSFRQGSKDMSVSAGRDEIAERCGLHPSVISRATTDLEDFGWLQKSGRGGRSMKTTYLITIPETVAESETVTHLATVSNHVTVTEGETVTESVSKTVADSATRQYRTEVNRHTCASKPKACDPEGFSNFWQQYPKKVAKPQALKAWSKIKPTGQTLADLMAGLERQKDSADWQKDGGQFIPYPASWLNGKRWLDETQPAAVPMQDRNSVFAGAI